MKLLLPLFAVVLTAYANTEKVIFVAPGFSTATVKPSVKGRTLEIDELSPTSRTLRKSLPVAFPSLQQPQGLESWYLLTSLNPRQRYEVRVCWAATQPSTFSLDTFRPEDTHAIPDSIQGLIGSEQHQLDSLGRQLEKAPGSDLLLRIESVATFYTINQTLMRSPPPVDVDIIIDPYLGNVFPASLVKTAVYIVVLAIGSWFVSGAVWRSISAPAAAASKQHRD